MNNKMSQGHWNTNDPRYLPNAFLPAVPILGYRQPCNYQELMSRQLFLSGNNSLPDKQHSVNFNKVPDFATDCSVDWFKQEYSHDPECHFEFQFSANISSKAAKQIFQTGSTVNQKMKFCVFCKKNGEPKSFFSSHSLHDQQGHVECPVLFKYKCSFCKATGILAHTDSHCPYFPRKAVISRDVTQQLFYSATKSSGEHRRIPAGFKQTNLMKTSK